MKILWTRDSEKFKKDFRIKTISPMKNSIEFNFLMNTTISTKVLMRNTMFFMLTLDKKMLQKFKIQSQVKVTHLCLIVGHQLKLRLIETKEGGIKIVLVFFHKTKKKITFLRLKKGPTKKNKSSKVMKRLASQFTKIIVNMKFLKMYKNRHATEYQCLTALLQVAALQQKSEVIQNGDKIPISNQAVNLRFSNIKNK